MYIYIYIRGESSTYIHIYIYIYIYFYLWPLKVVQQPRPSTPTHTVSLDAKIQSLRRTPEVFQKIMSTDRMLLKLARPGALAGQVIRHSTQVLENMLETHGPMVYKIGFSYDPHNRFFNKSFGYIHERQQWERMVIVYVSDETLGPAFLEAALIQRFKGPLIEWFVYRSSMLLYRC